MYRPLHRALSPEFLTIAPLDESNPLIHYAPYNQEVGTLSLSPVKGHVKRRRHKRSRPDSPTATASNKRQLVQPSPDPYDGDLGNPQASPIVVSEETHMHSGINLQIAQLNGYAAYVDYVLADCAGFCQISDCFYVVQGWDGRKQQVTVNIKIIDHIHLDDYSLLIEALVSSPIRTDRRRHVSGVHVSQCQRILHSRAILPGVSERHLP
jgi:hypothetical protein